MKHLKNISWFLLSVALGVATQFIAFKITQIIVPPGEGFLAGLGVAMAYLYASQWLAYALVFAVAWKITRQWKRAFGVCAGTGAAIWLVIVPVLDEVNMHGNRAATEKYRREEAEFKDEFKDPAAVVAAIEETRARIAASVTAGNPVAEPSCPSSFRIAEGHGIDFPEKYETLTLTFPLEVKEAGKYAVALSYIASGNGQQTARTHFVFSVDAPGRYAIEWPLGSGALWGYFVKSGESAGAIDIARNATLRETHPGIVNPAGRHVDDERALPVLRKEYRLQGIWVTPSKAFPAAMACQPPGAPRLVKQ